jgi:hypothetical protein
MATRAARRSRALGGSSLFVPRAITASAGRAADLPRAVSSTRVPQWQIDALAYYDQIGAVRYAAQFTARALPKIRWFPALRDENGEVEESEDPKLLELFDRIQDPGGGRTVLFATFGQLDFLTGECYLLWSQGEDDVEETWEIVSMLELRKQGKRGGLQTWHRISSPGLTPQELIEAPDSQFEPVGSNVQVYRWWRRHPGYSQMADSPMRSVLPECEEIVRATHSINARLISRLAGPGILAIPSSWSLKPLQQVVGEENPQEDPFQAQLTRAMVTAIGKPGSAESVAPIVVRVPDPAGGDMSKVWSLIKIWNPDEVIRELELREKAMQRFAVGVEMPPEKVMGLSISGSQHWNAWMIDEDSWGHIDPVAQSLADNLASSFLRPAAREAGFANWSQVVVGYDPAEILTNPDGFADALKLYEARAVNKEYLRAAGNAEDTDAMDDAELAEALFAQTHVAVEIKSGEIIGVKGVPARAQGTEKPPAAAPVEGQPSTDQPPTGQDTVRSAPAIPQDGMNASGYRMLGAAEAALEEIRSRVGSRLRSHLQHACPECAEMVKGVRSGLVAATLGPELVFENGPSDLVQLASDGGQNLVETLIRMGVSHTQAQALAEVIELHVISTIYDRAPDLPAGFVGRVKAISGTAA